MSATILGCLLRLSCCLGICRLVDLALTHPVVIMALAHLILNNRPLKSLQAGLPADYARGQTRRLALWRLASFSKNRSCHP